MMPSNISNATKIGVKCLKVSSKRIFATFAPINRFNPNGGVNSLTSS